MEHEARASGSVSTEQHVQMLRLAERMANLGHWNIDLVNNRLFWSDQIYRIHGVTPETYTPDVASAISFYHPEDLDRVSQHVDRAINEQAPFEFDARLIRPDGEIRHVLSRGEVQTGADGAVTAVFGIFIDVTEQRQTQELLEESNERYDVAIRGSSAGLWDWNLRTDDLYWSPQFKAIMKVTDKDFEPNSGAFRDRLHPDDLERVEANIAEHLAGKAELDHECRMRRDDGTYRWIHAHGQAIWDDQGNPVRMAGSVFDIEERKLDELMRAEVYTLLTNARLAPEDHFAQLLSIGLRYLELDIGIISRVTDGTYVVEHVVDKSEQLERGTTFILGDTYCANVVGRGDVVTINHAAASEIAGHPYYENFGLEAYIGVAITVAGKPYGTINFSSAEPRERPFGDRERSFLAMLAQWISNDIGQQQAFEQLMTSREILRRQRKELDLIFNLVPSSIWFMDEQFRVLRVNDQAAGIMNMRPDEVEGRSIFELMPNIEARYGDELREIMRTGEPIIGKVESTEGDDENASWVRIDKVPYNDRTSRDRKLITVATDITSFVQSQRALERHASLLERSNRDLDDFAYIASHDLRAPMRGIENLAQWIHEDIAEMAAPDTMEKLDMLRKRVARMDRMLGDILEYSRAGRDDAAVQAVDCQSVVEEVIEWVGERFSHEVVITSELPELMAQPTTVQQIFLNLVSNAAKHHDKPNGRIEVSCEADGAHYRFSVADNGPGIPERYRERIFRMFETLKRRDDVEGSGVGLAIVERLVSSLGGRIELHDGLDGMGCEFRVFIPRETREQAA
ncbi:MAG: PAS domain-containing protein [Pseudomonadota bacterium]